MKPDSDANQFRLRSSILKHAGSKNAAPVWGAKPPIIFSSDILFHNPRKYTPTSYTIASAIRLPILHSFTRQLFLPPCSNTRVLPRRRRSEDSRPSRHFSNSSVISKSAIECNVSFLYIIFKVQR